MSEPITGYGRRGCTGKRDARETRPSEMEAMAISQARGATAVVAVNFLWMVSD